jgi:hypothetical protein
VHSVYPTQMYARPQKIKQRLDPDMLFVGNIPIELAS